MVLHEVKFVISTYLQKTYNIKNPDFQVMSARSLEDGDFFTNAALKYANETGKKSFKLAEEIHDYLSSQSITSMDGVSLSSLVNIEVKAPGFLNFFYTDKAFNELLTKINKEKEKYGSPLDSSTPGVLQTGTKALNKYQLLNKNITVEFTDPNPFKEFHIGHLMSNTIGESIARILEFNNAHVRRVCYQGDVGMHVAKSIWGFIQKLEQDGITLKDLEQKSIEERVKYLGQSYALGANAYKDDENAKNQIQELNYLVYAVAQERLVEKEKWTPQVDYSQYIKNTTYDKKYIKELYYTGREWSLEYFDSIYALLGTNYASNKDFYFESEVGEYGLKTVLEYLNKDIFVKDDNAVIFEGEKYGLHNRVFINSKGLPTYEAKELGLAPKKYSDKPYDLSVIITGNEIDDYFKVLLKALSLIHPDLADKTVHLSHGMMRLKGVGKMSSRTGKVITGKSIIDDTTCAVKEKMKNELENIDDIASKVAVGAIKFSILKVSVGKNIEFDFEESISLQGISSPYIQYAHARACSVLSKSANISPDLRESKALEAYPIKLNTDEQVLLRNLAKFPEQVEMATEELSLHYICHYLFALAQSFNTFYNSNKIIGADNQAFRLKLTECTAQVLKNGLFLLGIEAPVKM